jgi:serine/threonine protein kinase
MGIKTMENLKLKSASVPPPSDWSHPSQWEDCEERGLEQGLIILGKYRLEEELGKGGMGVVWKATDLIQEAGDARDSYVAIKFLSRDFKQHPDALKALVREFKRYNRLTHPNIVKAHHLDRLGGSFFMVMEFLKGEPLNEFLKTHPNGLSLTEAEPIIKNLGLALAHAHQEGIAHLDFKPANVFYDPDAKSAKVIDFGIARPLEQSERDETLFDPGNLGALSYPYASREMLLGLTDPDPRDDIYALACVTYELLSGKHPFKRKRATLAQHEKLSPEPIKGLKKKQTQALLRGLAFFQDDRTPTVTQFLAELFPKKQPFPWGLVGVMLLVVAGFALGLFKLQQSIEPDGSIKLAPSDQLQQEDARKREEAARLAEQQRQRQQEQARKREEAARLAEQQRQRQQEQARKREEAARLAEQQRQRQQEQARKQEEARKRAETARLEQQRHQKETRAKVTHLLQKCQKHLNAQRLTTGRRGNARDCYQEVLKLDADNADALEGLHKIELSYQDLAERAFRKKQLDKVSNYLKRLEMVNPQSPVLADLRQRLEIERENLAKKRTDEPNKRAEAEQQHRQKQAQPVQVAHLLQKCQKHLNAQRLTTGQGGNARDCYQKVLKLDADNTDALKGLHQIERSYQAWAERAFRKKQLHKVSNYLKGLERVNPKSPILAKLRQRLKIEREKPRQQEVVRSVKPKAPQQIKPCKGCNCGEISTQLSLGIEPLTAEQKRFNKKHCFQ